ALRETCERERGLRAHGRDLVDPRPYFLDAIRRRGRVVRELRQADLLVAAHDARAAVIGQLPAPHTLKALLGELAEIRAHHEAPRKIRIIIRVCIPGPSGS